MSTHFLYEEVETIEKQIGYTFKGKGYLRAALSLSGFAQNDRLEFLGSTVLDLIIADRAFEKLIYMKEGALRRFKSKLTSEMACANYFSYLGINAFIETADRKNIDEKTAAKITLSLLGAVYKDGGLDAAKQFFKKKCLRGAKFIVKERKALNSRKQLEDEFRKRSLKPPIYNLIAEEGPEHEKIYEIGIFMEEHLLAKGKGRSKRIASAEAATLALTLNLDQFLIDCKKAS